MKITSVELREKYLDYFKNKNHIVLPKFSVIPENDPTVLFITAGMQPLVPYLMGLKHPYGTRLTSVQRCVRTGDIDEVGDSSHCTFFEMLGNWSLGDYFKKDMISMSYEFLTSKEFLGINKSNLAVSVFEGDDNAPRDSESAEVWQSLGIDKNDIYFLPKKHNWWGPAGITGPCGPDTEMFIKVKDKCCENCSPACDCGAFLEIWNDVFMQYNKTAEGNFELLNQKNVDTGMGLERTLCVLNNLQSVFDCDLFEDARTELENLSGKKYEDFTKEFRIILDHTRTAVMLIGDENGIVPSNVDQGYVLRRLIRRAIRYSMALGEIDLTKIANKFIEKYSNFYTNLEQNKNKILQEIEKECAKFKRTLTSGLKEFEKAISKSQNNTIDGQTAFKLFDTFGFPIEITLELATEKGFEVDKKGFDDAFALHQEKSRAGSEKKFKSGLADNMEETTALHTATHLLLATLKKMFGNEVNQRGSNITCERLRFDFNFDRPLTVEEQRHIEEEVNKVITSNVQVVMEEMEQEKARALGFTGIFADKYNNIVKTYNIGGYSKEMCGGPHVEWTGTMGTFKIIKEQSASAGVRRIKAILEK